MPFDGQITRSDADALIPQETFDEIQQGVTSESAVLALGRRLPNMSTGSERIAVLSALPIAYFNNAGSNANDTSYKNTTEVAWEGKMLNAEELAVIIPIPENVLADADYDIWDEIRPLLVDRIGAAIDAAVLFGVNAPNAWPDAVVPSAISAGNSVAAGTGQDLYADILGPEGSVSLIEEDGFLPNGHVSYPGFRGDLRGIRDASGNLIYQRALDNGQNVQAETNYMLAGDPIFFMNNGAFDASAAELVSGDFSQLVYSIRKDITYKMLDQSVIQDPATGDIVYNLAQQDMVALRVTMRLAWQVPNPVNAVNEDESSRYPFSVLTPAAS